MLRKARRTMAVRRMSSIIAILLVIAIGCFVVLCSMCQVDAMVDPSPEEENAKAAAASSSSTQTDTDSNTSKSKKKTKSSSGSSSQSSLGNNSDSSSQSGSGNNSTGNSDSDSDEDVLDENAFSTPGNASLGDVVRNSDSKDFYTIKTENDNTFYLVIDHAGSYDNVYMLSTIDENDLQDFLESEEDDEGGSLILPETNTTEESESKVETPEKETEKNRLPGIISLVLIVAAAVAGVVIYRRYRQGNVEPEEDYSENMEDDGIPTVNEDDEEFLG